MLVFDAQGREKASKAAIEESGDGWTVDLQMEDWADIAVIESGKDLLMSTTGEKKGPDWVCVTREGGWQSRDSAGEFVYKDHLWLLGGWFTPQTPNPRDVWKSPDGKTWTRTVEVAPWEYSDLSVALVHDGRMWFMGGRKLPGAENSNEVWSS